MITNEEIVRAWMNDHQEEFKTLCVKMYDGSVERTIMECLRSGLRHETEIMEILERGKDGYNERL